MTSPGNASDDLVERLLDWGHPDWYYVTTELLENNENVRHEAADTITSLRAQLAAAEAGLVAAIRAADLALFVIRKQGVMPNSSWETGFESDMKLAREARNSLRSLADDEKPQDDQAERIRRTDEMLKNTSS